MGVRNDGFMPENVQGSFRFETEGAKNCGILMQKDFWDRQNSLTTEESYRKTEDNFEGH